MYYLLIPLSWNVAPTKILSWSDNFWFGRKVLARSWPSPEWNRSCLYSVSLFCSYMNHLVHCSTQHPPIHHRSHQSRAEDRSQSSKWVTKLKLKWENWAVHKKTRKKGLTMWISAQTSHIGFLLSNLFLLLVYNPRLCVESMTFSSFYRVFPLVPKNHEISFGFVLTVTKLEKSPEKYSKGLLYSNPSFWDWISM